MGGGHSWSFVHLVLLWWSIYGLCCVGQNHQGTAIPKFGTWDVTDPKSGDGYSAIFSKVKEEKHNASSHSPSTSTPPLDNCSNIKNQYGHSSSLSKVMCITLHHLYLCPPKFSSISLLLIEAIVGNREKSYLYILTHRHPSTSPLFSFLPTLLLAFLFSFIYIIFSPFSFWMLMVC